MLRRRRLHCKVGSVQSLQSEVSSDPPGPTWISPGGSARATRLPAVRLFGCVLAASAFLACAAPPSALDGPTQAVVAQDGLVYVADGYFHARIAVFTPSGSFVRDWGSKGFEQGQLQTPHSLLEARDGTLVVADRDNGRLQRFGTSGEFVESVRSDVIGRPWSVAQTPEGHLFVADGGDQRPDAERAGIVELTASGDVLRRFSRFGSAPGELDEPHMLATAENGDVFVAEIGARRVQRFALRADCEASDPHPWWGMALVVDSYFGPRLP